MRNKTFLTLLIFIAIFIGVAIYFSCRSPDVNLEPVAPVENENESLPPVSMVNEKVEEKYYNYDLTYPDPSIAHLASVKQYVDLVKEEFLELVPQSDDQADYNGVTEARAYSLKIDTTTYTSSSTTTYRIEVYTFTGGAHGGTAVATFTYDSTGKLITLGDLLTSSESLNRLSSLSREYFYEKLGDSVQKGVVDAGTTPDRNNFNAWYLTDNAITFIFQQYQIGPYVLGIQEFSISRNEASTFLKL